MCNVGKKEVLINVMFLSMFEVKGGILIRFAWKQSPHFAWKQSPHIFKTVLSSGYILILLSIENILASLIETCQG